MKCAIIHLFIYYKSLLYAKISTIFNDDLIHVIIRNTTIL